MSGMRGCPAKGKVKLAVRMQKVGSSKKFTTHIFMKKEWTDGHMDSAILKKLLKKYPGFAEFISYRKV